MADCLVIGGGVIGLALAWQLAERGKRVRLLDRQGVGREASWAGAGILPPASREALAHPLDQLRGMSFELHREWAARLRAETGIDYGYRRCGGIYLSRTAGETAALAAWADSLREEGVIVERLSTKAIGPTYNTESQSYNSEYNAESQLYNTRITKYNSEYNTKVQVRKDAEILQPNAKNRPVGPLLKNVADPRQQQRQTSEKPLKSLLQREQKIVISPPAGGLPVRAAWLLPDECQLRNPWYLQALQRVCELRGVEITADCEVLDFELSGERVMGVITAQGVIRAEQVCVTSGAWTGLLLQKLGMTLGVVPMRGQMVLFGCKRPLATHVINEGPRYLVPREDGRLLAGSTEEEAGFDKRTTEEGIAELIVFARSLLPDLQEAAIERTWAGLRPASFDGFPYLGPIPGLTNAFVAAGHFRSGLYLSPGTATVMAELMCGAKTSLDLSVFRVGR